MLHREFSAMLEEHIVQDAGVVLPGRAELRSRLEALIDEHDLVLTRSSTGELVEEILDRITGLDILQPLIDDDEVTEIMVNSPRHVYVERHGRIERCNLQFRDDAHVRHVIERIVAPLGRRIDESCPMVDARLPDGSRVNAVIPPLAFTGPALTIRKFARTPFTLDRLVSLGTLTGEMASFLRGCVIERRSMVISGGTGSGKTSTLNALSRCIPASERIITIEDSAELQLLHEDLVPLEARQPNIEGKGEIPIRLLVRNALRMRPDRIIVGEVRGGEAFDMLQAMNTGHRGSMTTLHANSPRDALVRLESMVLMAGFDLPLDAIRRMIAGAIELIIQQDRLADGRRVITAVIEVHSSGGGDVRLRKRFVMDGVPG